MNVVVLFEELNMCATRGYESFTPSDVARHAMKHARTANAGPGKPKAGRSKYGAVKTTVGNITFDSAKEAAYWQELQIRVKAGEIDALERQPVYEIYILRDGYRTHIGNFRPDFRYFEKTAHGEKLRVDEVKGGKATKTEAYQLRKKLVEAIYGIEITEI